MLDNQIGERIHTALSDISEGLAQKGITAHQVTLAVFAIGCLSALAIWAGAGWTAFVLLILSWLGAGMPAAVARDNGETDFGEFLKAVLGVSLSGIIPLAFIASDPAANASAGSVLLVSLYINTASHLAFSLMGEKPNSHPFPKKSFFFKPGLSGTNQSYAVFGLACLFPDYFPVLAVLFAAICIYAVISRFVLAHKSSGSFPSL